jgi:hypothetical protein
VDHALYLWRIGQNAAAHRWMTYGCRRRALAPRNQ